MATYLEFSGLSYLVDKIKAYTATTAHTGLVGLCSSSSSLSVSSSSNTLNVVLSLDSNSCAYTALTLMSSSDVDDLFA